MSKRNVLRAACATAAAALLIACGTGTTPDGSPTATPDNQPTTIVLPQSPEATPAPAASSAKPAPVKTVTTFGDGMWEVPGEVKPGRYKTVVPTDSINCYYEVMKDFEGNIDSILTNGNQGPGKQVIMSIPKAAQGVEVSGCGTWVKVG